MVARKPLPDDAALDPAVPRQARDVGSPANTGGERPWGNETAQQHYSDQNNANPAPSDVPNSLKPGTTPFSGYEEESNIWAEGIPALARTEDRSGVPAVLRPGSRGRKEVDTDRAPGAGQDAAPVPVALRPGGGNPWPETNPFKRKMSLSASGPPSQGELSKQTTGSKVPTAPSIPVAAFSQMSVNETSKNPWQPALDMKKDHTGTPPVPKLFDQDSVGDNVWDSAKPSRQATPGPSASPAVLSLPSDDGSAGWDEEARKPAIPPPMITTANEEVYEDAHAWDDLGAPDKGKAAAPPPVPSKGTDDWNLVDVEGPGPTLSRQSTWENFHEEDGNAPKTAPATEAKAEAKAEEVPPELPPRKSAEVPPPTPPRPVDKSETYQIKRINWYDSTAAKNPRVSPILVQNANGPCPLVALVNALTLTTPADKSNTALVETLRSREQVSLGLLLDAVFDELMSERRTQPDVALPDVTELYNFLTGLHTGMNVNPRFIPAPEVVTAFKRTSLTHLHPTERTDMIPGTFEHTKEMALYSIFSIPLIHGWLPSKDDAAYDAFARQAVSYEDTQNLLFREEELEEKLSSSRSQGLTPEEQQIYQDILTIKSFLSISAAQLTQFGLDIIRKSMKPGSVAILFRNDHFSTLYRHPQTLELLTLVTDAGYAGHAEVVWESLVDINGESAEFLSGDFRVVGGVSHDQPASRDTVPENWEDAVDNSAGNNDWTTVQGRRGGRTHTPQQSTASQPPVSPTYEQEDRDLALALQLQEEEDERHRAAQERRRRESLLSEQFIEQQARSNGPAPTTNRRGGRGGGRGASTTSVGPGRATASRSTTSLSSTHATGRRASASASTSSIPLQRTNTTSPTPAAANNAPRNGPRPTTQTVRSLLPPTRDEDLPPPSYEQAAKQLPYVPPAGHPSHPASSPRVAGEGPVNAHSPLPAGMAQGPPQGQGPVRGGYNDGGRGHGQGQGHGQRQGGGYPGSAAMDGRGMRRGVPPAPGMGLGPQGAVSAGMGGGRERERDCVVM